MKPNDSSTSRKIILKCKPFDVLSDVPSPLSTTNVTTARRSIRLSRANGSEMEDSQRSTGKGKRKSQNSVESVTADDENDVVVVRKKRKPNKRRSHNRIQSSDDEDDNFVAAKTKSPQIKKRRSPSKVQSDGEDVVQQKSKTPVKRRKPLLTIKCNKITNYFGKATTSSRTEDKIPEVSEPQSVPLTPPPEVIVLSSSEEHDDVTEPLAAVEKPPMILSSQQQKSKSKCPDYKIVNGTNFAVDAFRFGEIAGVTTYFLTHFHSDHYVGLNKKFNKPIFMSTVTGRLVKAILKVNSKLIKTMNINTKYVIDGVEVTPIDANHCPGAVMFIFKLPCGRTILHTGDFRATPEMESNPVFWNNSFSSIYLDTTYLHKSYNFCTQSDALLYVEDEVKKFKQKNVGTKFVIVVGSYVIGKERVWSHIAQTFKMKVWLEAERRKAFDLIYSDENENHVIKDCISDVREAAQLHVIPIQCVNYSFLMDYLNNFEDHKLLAFRPTGWANNSKPQYGSRVSIVGVQYSEHSSYSELERFVRFVQPEKVISTVPISSGNPNTKNIPNNWLTTTRPMTTSQRTLTSYMRKRKTSLPVIAVDKLMSDTFTQISATQQLARDDAGSYDSVETDFMP